MFRPTMIRLLVLAFAVTASGLASAQSPAPSPTPGWQASPWADSVMVQSELRFELESPDGKGVSAQQWNQFATETVRPRFSDGVTVLEASTLTATGIAGVRVMLILHPNTPDALAKVGQITADYARRFGGAKATRLDYPVRVTP
ncbi:DUF3574 domain-containing protein [Aquabacter cavernae]|uniref:DUF3574 domain-containing protein n=1 Tax=Aquabacter cavernae TaxID=2496029 RepID=UPI000F8C7DE0|nr:DUF3574 domain-containing protein [Aquabacter cavernae]